MLKQCVTMGTAIEKQTNRKRISNFNELTLILLSR